MLFKGKILGIDYGTRNIGLAVSDDARLLAFGRGVLDRTKGFDDVVRKIKALCEKENVSVIVFGLPLDDEGQEVETAGKIRNFVKKFGLHFPGMPIHFIDESFSSFEAQNLQRESKRYGHDDELAATIILQRYLDTL